MQFSPLVMQYIILGIIASQLICGYYLGVLWRRVDQLEKQIDKGKAHKP